MELGLPIFVVPTLERKISMLDGKDELVERNQWGENDRINEYRIDRWFDEPM